VVKHTRLVAWLALLVSIFWLSGRLLDGLPGAMQALQMDGPREWLLPLLVGVVLVGYLSARVALALNPSALRALLTSEQGAWIGGLLTALLCVTWSGFLWSSINQQEVAAFIWSLLAGAGLDLFVLGWLLLAIRAAASSAPWRTGASFILGALGSIGASYGGLVLLILAMYHYELEPNLLLVSLFVTLVACLFLLPPMLLVAGVAALFAGMLSSGKPISSSDQAVE
jgi:hypothetical protein